MTCDPAALYRSLQGYQDDLRHAEALPGTGHDITHSHAELVNERLLTLLHRS